MSEEILEIINKVTKKADNAYSEGCADAAIWMLEACLKESFNYCQTEKQLYNLEQILVKMIRKQIESNKPKTLKF